MAQLMSGPMPAKVSSVISRCVFTTRLLGSDPRLVLHGGGNTSVKLRVRDLVGDDLCVKGSGWDMAAIEPQGLPAVKLGTLLKARSLDALSDEDSRSDLRTGRVTNVASQLAMAAENQRWWLLARTRRPANRAIIPGTAEFIAAIVRDALTSVKAKKPILRPNFQRS
jgi:Class II Aldolase and Adducin N-terminal domain